VDAVLDDLVFWDLVEHESEPVAGRDGREAVGGARVDRLVEHVGPELGEAVMWEPSTVMAKG
jgi:hypothetical protein